MVRGPLGLIPYRSPSWGLVILISIYCSGLASAWRGEDGNTSPALLRNPLSPNEAGISSRHGQPKTHKDPSNRKSPAHPLSTYDILQHALWDEKMSDDAGDIDNDGYEARKWSHLQGRVDDNYVQRTIDYLLNRIEADADEHPREEGYGLDSQSRHIDVQRRSSFPDTCGRRDIEPEVRKRVVMGRKAGVGKWPWLVQLSEIGAEQPYCGGTLLSEEFVLTAAHCFDRHDPKDVVVIIGDRNRFAKEGTEQRFRVGCVYIHEAYIPRGDYKDDIALVRLKTDKKKVKMSPAVQPVCLPPQQRSGEPDMFKSGERCFVVGWGFTDPLTYFNSQHPAILHEARLPILPPKSCRDAYGSLYTDKMVCAGHMTGVHRTDACKGDSGGPLMCREKTGHWVVWGIVSWGHNYFCNGSPDKPIPTVYTKVEEYLPWLINRLRFGKC